MYNNYGGSMEKIKKIIKKILFLIIIILLVLVFDYIRINIRYFVNKSKYENAFKVYGNKDGYVPQGLAYSEKYNIVIQTAYSKKVSKIFLTDFKSGKLIKELKLINKDGANNYKHVGGVAINNEYVWISNDYELDIYKLDDIYNTNDDNIRPIDEIKLDIRGDFCYYNNDILWIGDFYLKPFYDVPNGDPKLYGYKINESINYDKPDYVYSLPKSVQGMVILPDGKFAFTESFTYLVNSNLDIYENIMNTERTVFNKKNRLKRIKIPPMAEGMFYKDGYIYILFESSTENYSMADPKIDTVIKYKIKE